MDRRGQGPGARHDDLPRDGRRLLGCASCLASVHLLAARPRASQSRKRSRGAVEGQAGRRRARAAGRESQASPGIPQAAIDASNAARRAGLGSVARKGASEVVSPRKGAAPERNAPPRGPATSGPTRATSGERRAVQSSGAATKRPARTVNRDTGSKRAGGEPSRRRGQRLRRRRRARQAARSCSSASRMRVARSSATASARPGGCSSLSSARLPAPSGVRELYGLTLYRLGEYRKAAKELEAFRTLSVVVRAQRRARGLLPSAASVDRGRRALGRAEVGFARSRGRRRWPHRDGRRARRSGQAAGGDRAARASEPGTRGVRSCIT